MHSFAAEMQHNLINPVINQCFINHKGELHVID